MAKIENEAPLEMIQVCEQTWLASVLSIFVPRDQFQHWVALGMWFGKGTWELCSGMLMLGGWTQHGHSLSCAQFIPQSGNRVAVSVGSRPGIVKCPVAVEGC